MFGDTVYICSKCGRNTQTDDQSPWLIAAVYGSRHGEMVIRCPRHITEYAIRKAGGSTETRKDVGLVGVVNGKSYEIVPGESKYQRAYRALVAKVTRYNSRRAEARRLAKSDKVTPPVG